MIDDPTATLDQLNPEALSSRERELNIQYQQFRLDNLSLDLTRGKPSPSQLALSNGLDEVAPDFIANDGTDTRNYGGLDGLSEARQLGADLLGVDPEEVIAGGNSSLTLMYLYLLNAWHYGPPGTTTPWREAGPARFLCPVPGYDRHFRILEDLGIEMVNVAMELDGPNMDQVEEQIKNDDSIRGIWCVPKYSNPGGQVYSDATIDRLAKLSKSSNPLFRVMCDNAYAVHDLDDDCPDLANVMDAFRLHGSEDKLVMFGSTSKITRAGAGISFISGSRKTLHHFKERMQVFTIGPDKVTQLRHVRFLRDLEGIKDHMRKHAQILKPKFNLVQDHLSNELEGAGMGEWTKPRGGYFLSYNSLPGLASKIVELAAAAGVKLTPAGSTFPYRRDPDDINIRLAPTFPDLHELDKAMKVFVVCVQLASIRQALTKQA